MIDNFRNRIICGDCLEVLKQLPDESVNCCITSPPYWALRDYGVEGQLGLEPTFQEYLDKLIIIFDEVKRVLRKDGTCWVVLGDTYGGFRKGSNIKFKAQGLDKCLLQIPARFAIMMIDRGWRLRNEIIWQRPNNIPSSVRDRFTMDYEKVYFFTKNKKYWFTQQFEEYAESSKSRMKYPRYNKNSKGASGQYAVVNDTYKINYGRNKRCVWSISTKPFKGPHYAVFPSDLIEPMIKAGCPEFICKKCGRPRDVIIQKTVVDQKNKKPYTAETSWIRHGTGATTLGSTNVYEVTGLTDCGCNSGWDKGIVLDPFIGSGTTGLVAKQLGRDFIGIELNPDYCKLAEERLKNLDSGINQKRNEGLKQRIADARNYLLLLAACIEDEGNES